MKRRRQEYRRLLDNLKAIARSEEKDWRESDWSRAVRRATSAEPEEAGPARRRRPGWAWAYAAVMAILLGGAAVATRSFFHEAWPTLIARSEPTPSVGPAAAGRLARQNQLSVTFVSGESGLQVYWFFDKDFDWKEEKL